VIIIDTFNLELYILHHMARLGFDKRNFLIALVLFLALLFIALFVKDQFIRPVFGDYLVVIFMYYAIASLFDFPLKGLVIGILLFSYAVEIGQYYNLVYHLGLKGNRLAEIVIGVGFTWTDMLAYTIGALTVYLIESKRRALPS
jgi:hypothetical protein